MARKKCSFVVGDLGHRVVIAPQKVVDEYVRLWKGLETAKTWGEFKKKIPREYYQWACTAFLDDEEEQEGEQTEPPASLKFDKEEIPGFLDGDWPPILESQMDEWVPKELLDALATKEDNMLRQQWYQIKDIDAVEKWLQERKIAYVRDDEMIRKASGGFHGV